MLYHFLATHITSYIRSISFQLASHFFSLVFPFVLNRKSYTTTVINFGILGICWLPRGKIGEKSTSIEQFLKTRMQWVLTAEALGFFFFFFWSSLRNLNYTKSNKMITWIWAIFIDKNAVGIGVVIRNFDEHVMSSIAQRIPLPFTVDEVEALVAWSVTPQTHR